MFQRHLSTFLIALYSFFSLACLSWSADSVVRTFKHTFFYLVSPASLPLLTEMEKWGNVGRNMSRMIQLDQTYRALQERWESHRLDEKRLEALERENERLAALLNITPLPSYVPTAARILARDPHDWFHSILIRLGTKDGVSVSDPVVALQGGREVFVGQVVEVMGQATRVLLVTDPLSAVSARLSRTGEQGAVEGQGTNRLVMNYLFSDTDVKVGDEVVTAGLGQILPEGILLGHVASVEATSRQSFKRALLKPAVRLSRLEEVIILKKRLPQQPPDLRP